MRLFKSRGTPPADLSSVDSELARSQLENTMKYGWHGVTREKAIELIREAVSAEPVPPTAERPLG